MRNRSPLGALPSPSAHSEVYGAGSTRSPVAGTVDGGCPGDPRPTRSHPRRPRLPARRPSPSAPGASGKYAGRPRLGPPPPSPHPAPKPSGSGFQPGWHRPGEGKPPANCSGQLLPSPPGTPPRPARHQAPHVYTPQLRYDGGRGGGTKRILFSKVSLRFGGGTGAKRKRGLSSPGIRILISLEGRQVGTQCSANSGTLATAAGAPAPRPCAPGPPKATGRVSQRLCLRPRFASAEPPTRTKLCLKARGSQENKTKTKSERSSHPPWPPTSAGVSFRRDLGSLPCKFPPALLPPLPNQLRRREGKLPSRSCVFAVPASIWTRPIPSRAPVPGSLHPDKVSRAH